jgi:hypothetical protein
MVSIVVLDRSLLDGLFAVQREHISLTPRPYLYLDFSHQQHPLSVSLTIPFGKSSATPHRLSDTYYSTLVGDQKQTWKTGIVS